MMLKKYSYPWQALIMGRKPPTPPPPGIFEALPGNLESGFWYAT
jgi:hypothetical protein